MRSERQELLEHVQGALEPLMVALGLLFLGLLIVEFSDLALSGRQQTWLGRTQWTIYGFFVVDFALRFVIAPSKTRYLRANWLTALSLVLPILRPLRALRAARALRSIRLVHLLSGANRSMRTLRRITRGRQFAYLGALTVLVVLLGAVGVLTFDRDVEGASIRTFGDAVWWAATLVTTINTGQEAVSLEARVIAILLRLYAVSVFGYVTAAIASYFIGRDAEKRAPETDVAMREELSALRREVARLRRELAGSHDPAAD